MDALGVGQKEDSMINEIRVGIIGIGNCANSLMQGLSYYARAEAPWVGLVRPRIGSYTVKDIKVVSAFDVTEPKVRKPLSKAVWAFPNDTFHFADIPLNEKILVSRGPTLDGLGIYIKDWVEESGESPDDVVEILKDTNTQVLINYLPVGSENAAWFYAQAAIKAKCAFINCMPAFIASNPNRVSEFFQNCIPIIGDDIKSQVGATIVHRALAQLFRDRGVTLDRTYQINIGGNGDFKNMLQRERLISKKISKTEAVVSISGIDFAGKDVHIGPSDYVEWLGDKKIAYIRLEGRGFGGAPLNAEVKLEVWDSPNSAGIVIDAIRVAKLALDRGEGGCIDAPSSYFMKRPPIQVDDDEALKILEDYINWKPKAERDAS